MVKSPIRLVTLTLFLGALATSPATISAFAAGGGDPGSPDIMRPSSSMPPCSTPASWKT